jgi:hypothetical protein
VKTAKGFAAVVILCVAAGFVYGLAFDMDSAYLKELYCKSHRAAK